MFETVCAGFASRWAGTALAATPSSSARPLDAQGSSTTAASARGTDRGETPGIGEVVTRSSGRPGRPAAIPAYGIGIFPLTVDDEATNHGADERMPTASLGAGLRLLHEIVLEAAARR